ncbi:N-acetylglucosaminyl transferase component [Artemisia annua]|uniref:N-acetylglucosaminyl transferase component n=1 Tax=Artemisia annua TaxID=35608 RepID=A0A2U1QIQ2_ARTAN|nr:N-acetylglucosaminyl transferase component [Artemisia annua]
MNKKKCRIWWPAHLSLKTQSSFLFGWFISSSSSDSFPLEIVVAFTIDEDVFYSIRSDLQGILLKINKRMPTSLQNRCGLSLLGYCSADSSTNGELRFHPEAVKENGQISPLSGDLGQHIEDDISKDRSGQRICGCHKVDGLLEYHRRCTDTDPIQLVYGSYISPNRKFGWIPNLNHIHWDGQVVSNIDLHIVIYGTPRFGGHHFSLGPPNSSEHAKTFSRKPKWVEDLGQKKSILDLDAVILATNCAAAASSLFKEQLSPDRPALWFITLIWQLLAAFVASTSTFIYMVLQLLHFLLCFGSESWIYVTIERLFIHTWRDIRFRSCQILYWPIFLHHNDSRSEACVEYAEKASVCKHSMWLSVVIDVLLGNLFGLALMNNVDSVCSWIFTITSDITNNWWLISCARLMGNPAGFKLNTELAGVLGTLSLNSIQIWTTLCGSLHFLFIFFVKGLAISGVLFGLTTPAALTVDIVIYGTPRFGGHHFSLGPPNSSEHAKTFSRKPKWVEDLGQKKSILDLDAVILATNCAAAASSLFKEQLSPDRPALWFITLIWQLLAAFVASTSTFIYMVLQLLHFLLCFGSESWIYVTIERLFIHTWRDIRFRSCQILYWPIFLHHNDSRSEACVEYAEKASVCKHSMWLSVVIDVLLGNLFGLALMNNVDSVCSWIFTITSDITNNWWLISCARLMGNPAGFKLNTELAGVLGTLSLNSIQIWTTLCGSLHFLFILFVKGLAISGVLFGLTTPAALTVDVITISTTHVSTLHWLISLIYSRQIQATTALWRLFRGQKWNPLRERLDSYDYTVEQHIVGSLLFTPLLLLLPTTSAFYMSFTIMNMTIAFICMIIEVAISVIHATPYNKIILWLLRPSRFPCGIWFEIFSVKTHATEAVQGKNDTTASRSDLLVSSLHSYSYDIGALVRPHFRYLSSAVPRSSIRSSVYRVFSGRSLPSPLYNLPFAPRAGLPPKMPWMSIPFKEYWILCYDAVFACKPLHRHTKC